MNEYLFPYFIYLYITHSLSLTQFNINIKMLMQMLKHHAITTVQLVLIAGLLTAYAQPLPAGPIIYHQGNVTIETASSDMLAASSLWVYVTTPGWSHSPTQLNPSLVNVTTNTYTGLTLINQPECKDPTGKCQVNFFLVRSNTTVGGVQANQHDSYANNGMPIFRQSFNLAFPSVPPP